MRLNKSVEKNNLIYCIDQMIVFPLKGNYRLSMRGWAFLKGNPEAEVILAKNACVENLVMGQTRRADVSEHYSQYGNIADCGFECQLDFGEAVDLNQKLEFYLKDGESGEQVLFFAISFGKLKQYLMTPGISCKVEEFYFLGGRMVATGWAYANLAYGNCQRPGIRVWNASGREVPCKISDVTRLDIEQMTGQQELKERLGFRLEWQAKKDETYQIEFEVEGYKKRIAINEMGAKRVLHYGRKAVHKGGRIVKRILHIGRKSYDAWEKEHRVTKEEWERQRQETFPYMPKISIVVPAYRTPEQFLREMIDSVRGQSYENWELCIGDGSVDESICGILEEYAKADSRIKYERLADNYGISGNTNEALKLATGDYISLLDHDDLLTPDVLYEVVKRINETGAEALYTDEDKVTMDLKEYFEPHFKSDYSLELLRSCNYICHFFVVKRNIFEQVGAFREECNGSQDYDYILRCTSAANRVEHIAKILYHWRCHPNSTAGDPQSKMYCYEAGKRSLELDLEAHGIKDAEVSIDAHFGYYRVAYPVREAKTAVVILPDGNETNLQLTIDSIKQHTPEGTYEIVVAEAGKPISGSLNQAAKQTDAEYLVFMQAGMTARGDDWLGILLGNCQRDEVGAVSAPVLVNGRYVAHSGKLLGVGGDVCQDMFAGCVSGDAGYAGRMLAQQNARGISWKSMMIERSVFLEMGGFCEQLKELYMDIDLCLKLQQAGKMIVYTPYTEFYMERSTFYAQTTKNQADEAYMWEKWRTELEKEDPYYNRNFDVKAVSFSKLI